MSSLAKGERLCTELVELFANRVVERRNIIMSIYGGELALRVLGGVYLGGVLSFLDFEFFLEILCHFAWFVAFLAFCWLCCFCFF
jgi:hypothetical protein